jgi:hypothetical protein
MPVLSIFLARLSSLFLSHLPLSLTSMSDPTQAPFTQRPYTQPPSGFPHPISLIDSRASYPDGVIWQPLAGDDRAQPVSSIASLPPLPPPPPNTPRDWNPNTFEPPQRRGRPNGSGNFADQDLKTLLMLIEAELPLGNRGWQAVHSRYTKYADTKGRPRRTAKSLENKFRQVCFIYIFDLVFFANCPTARENHQAHRLWYSLPPRCQGPSDRHAHQRACRHPQPQRL